MFEKGPLIRGYPVTYSGDDINFRKIDIVSLTKSSFSIELSHLITLDDQTRMKVL